MAEYADLTRVLQELLMNKFSPKPSFTRGILGDGNGNVTVPERPDKNYVRFNRGANEFFEVFNRTVNPVEGWPVLIGELPWQPGLTQVVDTDWAAFEQSGWGDSLGSTSPHAPTHEWPDGAPGSDPVNIYGRSIVPLRTYADNTGTVVYTNAYEYEYYGSGHVWGGTPGIDLSPVITSMPSGTMRFMGIYLDPDTNTLGIITGATTIFTSAFDPPRVQFPANVLPSARVRVYGSQANVTEFDMRDARQPFSVANWWDAEGDLTGTYPNPQVSGLFGYPLEGGAPSEGDIWMYTGSLWRHIPGSSIGGGAWPPTDKTMIDTTQYNSLTEALAALGASGTIKIGDGYFYENVTITGSCHLVGTGKYATVISDAVATGVINTKANVTLENMTIINTFIYAAGVTSPTALNINSDSLNHGNVTAINCRFIVDADTPDDCRAVRVDGAGSSHRLLECDGFCDNADGTGEAISFGDGDLEVREGTWDGKTYDLEAFSTADTLILNDPIFANDDNGDHISINAAVAIKGQYIDGDGDIIQPSTSNDVFASGDGSALFQRKPNLWFTSLTTHFNEFTGWTWAGYAGFVTPANINITTYPSLAVVYNSAAQGAARAFAYRGSTTIRQDVLVAATANVRSGLRQDDGTNNNYFEFFIETDLAGNIYLRYRYAVGGVVTGPTTVKTLLLSQFLSLRLGYTAPSTWSLYAAIDLPNTQVFLANVTAAITPTRPGIYHENLGSSFDSTDLASYFEWYRQS